MTPEDLTTLADAGLLVDSARHGDRVEYRIAPGAECFDSPMTPPRTLIDRVNPKKEEPMQKEPAIGEPIRYEQIRVGDTVRKVWYDGAITVRIELLDTRYNGRRAHRGTQVAGTGAYTCLNSCPGANFVCMDHFAVLDSVLLIDRAKPKPAPEYTRKIEALPEDFDGAALIADAEAEGVQALEVHLGDQSVTLWRKGFDGAACEVFDRCPGGYYYRRHPAVDDRGLTVYTTESITAGTGWNWSLGKHLDRLIAARRKLEDARRVTFHVRGAKPDGAISSWRFRCLPEEFDGPRVAREAEAAGFEIYEVSAGESRQTFSTLEVAIDLYGTCYSLCTAPPVYLTESRRVNYVIGSTLLHIGIAWSYDLDTLAAKVREKREAVRSVTVTVRGVR